jgi:hypothetical protein
VAEGGLKILFIARHFAYFRNYEAAIAMLAARGHALHLAVERGEELGGREMVERLAAEHPGITLGTVPEREGAWAVFATRLRMTIAYLRYLEPAYDRTPQLRARARERVPRLGLWLTDAVAGSGMARRVLYTLLVACERAIPRSPQIDAFMRHHNPDAVLLTPLIGVVASPQLDCLQSAQALGYPTALCVWSWDHLSSKAIVRLLPDRVLLWNSTQREEALTLHGVPADRIVVTGAQCFDQWFDRRPSTDRAAFCRQVGLPADRPFLLYVCSSLFRGTVNEAQFVQRWIRALRASGQEPLASAPILVRPHPARMKQWADVDLGGEPGVAVWGQSPVTPDAKNGYFDSLHHSAAVVGLNTSAFLEAAIVGRPVHAPLLPEHYENQEGTIHFHYLMNVGGGLLHTARTLAEHFAQLNAVLASGERESERSHRFVDAFIRPHGRGVPATPFFADAVEALAAAPAAARGRAGGASLSAALIRLLLSPVAALLALDAAEPLMASARDRAVAARQGERRVRDEQRRQRKVAQKAAQQRDKQASVEARRRHKAQRLAEWHRAKSAQTWKRRLTKRIGLDR